MNAVSIEILGWLAASIAFGIVVGEINDALWARHVEKNMRMTP